MSKAFIFDMDGVLINSEAMWTKYENNFLDGLFGKKIAQKIGDTVGVGSKEVYEKARSFGFDKSLESILKIWDETAFRIYDKARISPSVGKLGDYLIEKGFKIGIVSSSRLSWVERVLPRLSFGKKVSSIISLADDNNFRPKPSPDGYQEMIRILGSVPLDTIILEDSNTGIRAAVDSEAYTISFSQNLIPGYQQIKIANAKAKNMKEVVEIVRNWIRNK